MQHKPGTRQIAADRVSRLPWLVPPAGYILLIQDVAYGNRYKIARQQQLDRHLIKRGADFPFETRVALILEADNAAQAERDLHDELAAGTAIGDWFDLDKFPKEEPVQTIPPVPASQEEAVSLRDLVENDDGADSLLQNSKVVGARMRPSAPQTTARRQRRHTRRRRPRVTRWAVVLGLIVLLGVFVAEHSTNIWRVIGSLLDEIPEQSTSPTSTVAGRGEVFFTGTKARVRNCAAESCSLVAVLNPGTRITARRYVTGEWINGSRRWISFHHRGAVRYIHESALARAWPPDEPTPGLAESTTGSRSFSPTPRIEGRGEVFYTKTRSRVRSCANLSCRTVVTLSSGSKITARRFVSGQQVNGSARWIAFLHEGVLRYIHDSVLVTNWPIVEATPEPSPTPRPTRIKGTAVGQGEVFYVRSIANARRCARLSCEVLEVMLPGTKITALRFLQGQEIDSNDLWIRFSHNSRHLSIHSGKLTRTPPTAQPTRIKANAEGQGEVFYVKARAIARACAQTSCEILEVLPPGTMITALSFEKGQRLHGSDLWIRFSYNSRNLSIHSEKLTRSDPTADTARAANSDSTSNTASTGTTFYLKIRARARTCAWLTCDSGVTLPQGTEIRAKGYVSGQAIAGNNRWVLFNHKGQSLYILQSWLSRHRPLGVPTARPSPTAQVIEPNLPSSEADLSYWVIASATVYKCANTRCQAIDVLKRGAEVIPSGQWYGQRINGSNKWFRLRHEDQTVYIHSSYVSQEEPVDDSANDSSANIAPLPDERRAVSGGQIYYVSNDENATVFNCASVHCVEVGVLPAGTRIDAGRVTRGQMVNGSNEWISFYFDGWYRFVHSGELSPLDQPSDSAAPAPTQLATTEAPATTISTATEPPAPTVTATVAFSPKYLVATAGNANANIRACPRMNCEIVANFAPGTEVDVIGQVSGETVYGTDIWLEIGINGSAAYIHSELVAEAR